MCLFHWEERCFVRKLKNIIMNLEQQRWYSGGDCTVGLVKYGLWAEKWLSDLTPSVIRCSTSINLPWPDPLSIGRVCYTTAEQCAVLVSSHCRRIPFNCAAFAENFLYPSSPDLLFLSLQSTWAKRKKRRLSELPRRWTKWRRRRTGWEAWEE